MKPPFNLWCTVTLRREFIWVLLYKPPLGFSSFPSRRLHVEPPTPWRLHSPELTSQGPRLHSHNSCDITRSTSSLT
ncbi:hypothetical protein Hanom_Chr10g00914651 [Helianthus anomalus]